MIQIGTESGLLPAPVIIPSTPVNYNYNRRDITVLNVDKHGLLLGPAERADVLVDFSPTPTFVNVLPDRSTSPSATASLPDGVPTWIVVYFILGFGLAFALFFVYLWLVVFQKKRTP